jgi:HEAT repeat protein
MSKACAGIAVALVSAVALGAQAPRISNGKIATQAAGTPFVQSFRSLVSAQPDASWIGYTVPIVDGERTMCCFGSGTTFVNGSIVMSDGSQCCGSCRLEPSEGASMATRRPQSGVVKLEGSDLMTVLVRVAERKVDRVRIFSEDCELDAGGRPVVWLENVRPADSIALLESFVAAAQERRDRVADSSIGAIALHADGSADAALDRLLAASQPSWVREKVPFWLGNARGRHGLDVLRKIVRDDASTEMRKKAIFGISQSKEPDAVNTLIDAARNSTTTSIRGEAIFWLGQKAGSKAAAAITERIEQDPDTEVKKKAVFALSQLPKDEGVPLLINVAKTNTNPAVRKQAMFWLGQSKDPRAIDFFAEILSK